MEDNPFISIIIPSYNRASFLKKNIPGLLALNYEHFEIIVVDDGSKDDTAEVMNAITAPNLRFFQKANQERAAARNYGAEYATGDYITFLDSDDIFYQDALANTAQVLEQLNYPPFLHMAYEIGTPDRVDKVVNRLPDNNPLILVAGNPLSCMGVFIQREVFYRQRFYSDRALSGSEDWECWLRLAANYGLRTSRTVIGRVVEHDSRSVKSFSEKELTERRRISFNHAFADAGVQRVYGRYRKRMEAYWATYIALHLALYGQKSAPWHYFISGLKKDVRVLFSKRAMVICKLLLFKKPQWL